MQTAELLVEKLTYLATPSRSRAAVQHLGELNILRKQSNGFRQKYKLGKMLASGAGGLVYMATETATGAQVVVKAPKNRSDTSDFDALVAKKHPNIVRVFECFHSATETHIVLELCAGGDLSGVLQDMVRNYGGTSEKWCAGVFQQALRGVSYLHEHFHQSHNDLKPENMLCDRRPAHREDVPRVAVSDFGCAGSCYSIEGGDRWGAGGSWIGATGGGDLRYRAPETFHGRPFSAATDMWSLGVTLYELLSGGLLIYVNQRNVSGWSNFCALQGGTLWKYFLAILQSGKEVDVSWVRGKCGRDLLSGLLCINLEKRLTINAAISDPWFEVVGNADHLDHRDLGDEVTDTLRARVRGSSLRFALLNLVGAQLQGRNLDYYRELWDQYDKDGDGVMNFQEFHEMMQDHGMEEPRQGSSTFGFLWGSRPSHKSMFALGDVDGSGTIDFQEFVGLMFNAGKLDEAEKLKYFKSAFCVLAGSKGKISAEDLAGLFPHFQGDRQAVDKLFNQIDEDGDGEIDYEEFAQFVDLL